MEQSKHPFLNNSRSGKMQFTFNGQPVDAYEGQTIAGALIQAGFWEFGKSRSKLQSRGLFCSQGWCANCYVVVDGQSRVPSCSVKVQQGMKVTSQEGDPLLAEVEDE